MDVFDVVGLKCSRIIMRELSRKETLRYSELQEAVGSPSTTNLALDKLRRSSLVSRRVLDEPYRPVAYSLTEAGRKVAALVKEMENVTAKSLP